MVSGRDYMGAGQLTLYSYDTMGITVDGICTSFLLPLISMKFLEGSFTREGF